MLKNLLKPLRKQLLKSSRISKKPDITRDKIVELMGDIPRIELFARQKTEGWDIWGNELKNDLDIPIPRVNEIEVEK